MTKHSPHYFISTSTSSPPSFEKKTIDIPLDSPSLQPKFLTDVVLKWQSFAYANIDFIANNILNDKGNGYFVDLAASEWKFHSNTFMFEHFNMWKGVCIELNPKFLPGLLSNRKCDIYTNPVSNTTGQSVKFTVEKGVASGISTNSSETTIDLTTVTLMDILIHANAPAVIDFLSLNTNGAEYTALQTFDFSKYTFLVVAIDRPPLALHQLLVKNEYTFVYEMVYMTKCLYIHKSLPNHEQVMKKYYKHHNA